MHQYHTEGNIKLNALEIPTSFIWGSADAFESPTSGLDKARQVNGYQFKVIKDAGHSPWLDKPEETSELILSMLG